MGSRGGGKIEMIVPYDCRTHVNGRKVHGIPDRTIGALLVRLADAKHDNIVGSTAFSLSNHPLHS